MVKIPGFDELIKQFIEAMKNQDALKTSEAPPQRTFPIVPAGGVQSAIEITKNIGSKVAEANKKAEKIIGLGESYISGEMSFPEYLNRVQEATLSQGSVLGLPSEKDRARKKFSFRKNQARTSGGQEEGTYLNMMRDETSSRNMYQALDGGIDSLINLEKFLLGALENVNSGLIEPREFGDKGPDMFTLDMQQKLRETRIKGIHDQMDAATDISRVFTTALEGLSQGIPFRDTQLSVPSGEVVGGKPQMMSLTINQIPGYIEQFIKGAEYNVKSLVPEYDKGKTVEVVPHGGIVDWQGPLKGTEYTPGLPTDRDLPVGAPYTPSTKGITDIAADAADELARGEQKELLEVDELREKGEYPLSANRSTIENHYLFGGSDNKGRESANTILKRIGADLEDHKLLNTEADPSIQQDIIEHYEGEKGQLIVNPEGAIKEYNRQKYKDVPGMYGPVQLTDEMLDSLINHQNSTIALWASNEPIKRNLKIGYHESLKVDKTLDHILEFNRWHLDKFGIPAWADMRNANNEPLLPSNFNDIATFSQKVNPDTLKDFIVDKFYQNFPDSSKGQFILDEDMDKVLLSFNADSGYGTVKSRTKIIPHRTDGQIKKDLEKIRKLMTSGKLNENPTGKVITGTELDKIVGGIPQAYRGFVNAWRSGGGISLGNEILDQLHKSAGRKGDVAQEALDAWDLIRSSNMSHDARKPIRNEISTELQARLDASFAAWVRQEAVDWRDFKEGGSVKEDILDILKRLQPIMEEEFYNHRPWNRWGN